MRRPRVFPPAAHPGHPISSPRPCTTGTRGFGFTGEMLNLLDRDTHGRASPHSPPSPFLHPPAPRCFSGVDLTVRSLRTRVEALPASHLNLNLKLDERNRTRLTYSRGESRKITDVDAYPDGRSPLPPSRSSHVLGIEGREYREFDRWRRTMIYGRKGRNEVEEKKEAREGRETESAGPAGVKDSWESSLLILVARPSTSARNSAETIASTDRSRDTLRRDEKES